MSWELKRLGDVAQVVRGISYKSSEIVPSGGVPMVNLKNVSKGGGYRTEGTKQFTGAFKPEQVLATGDLLVAATDLSKAKDVLGSPFVIPQVLNEAVFSLDLIKLEPDSTQLDTGFLYFYLRSPRARVFTKSIGRGITVMHMSSREFPNLQVPVPPLEEQIRIVAQLEDQLGKLEAVREALRKAELGLDEMLGSVLHDFVGGGVDSSEPGTLPFSDCFHLVSNPHAGYQQKDYKQSGAVPVVDQGRDLVGGFVDETERVIRALRPVIVFGDHTRVLKFVDFDFAAGADGTKLLQTNQDLVNDRFGFYMLRATRIRNRGYARHFGELRKLNFKVPSFEDQNRIVALVDGFLQSRDSVIGQLGASADLLDSARSSILHRAFLAPEEAV